MKALREAAGIPEDDARLTDWPGLSMYQKYEARDPELCKTMFPEEITYYRTLEHYADLFGVSLDTLVGRQTPQTAAPGAGLAWHLTAETPPPTGQTVIFWGSKGLRVPPAACISGFIAMLPDEYTWWAVVTPPDAGALAPADDAAAESALAPAT